MSTQRTPSPSFPEAPRVSRFGIWVSIAVMAVCVIALTVFLVVQWEGFKKQPYFWAVFFIMNYVALAWIISSIVLQSDLVLDQDKITKGRYGWREVIEFKNAKAWRRDGLVFVQSERTIIKINPIVFSNQAAFNRFILSKFPGIDLK